jgi:phosphoribosylamine-glycine ligase
VIESDPVEWMLDTVEGGDSLKVSDAVATGIVLTHGDYPQEADSKDTWIGFPINGVSAENVTSLHFQDAMEGDYITLKGKKRGVLSAGCYIMVVTGTGETVSAASRAAYKVAWQVRMPSNLMFRTDIGDRLRKDLPRLHKLGYAREVDY